MKKWLLIPILVILFFLLCCQSQEKAEETEVVEESGSGRIAAIAQTIANNLDLAVENLEKGQIGEGAGLLLDSVLLAKPNDMWPEGFSDNISTAKENFVTGNFSDAVGNVTKALNLIKQPEDAEQSAESGEMAPLAEIMKGKIEESKEQFKKGNPDGGVISILEALQLFALRTK
jgi:hypothetical protein